MQFCIPFLQNFNISTGQKLIELDISELSAGKFQPRRDFPEQEISALSKSIANCGILQPPLVRKSEQGYEIVCGERRVRAASLAGLTEIPCMIADLDDKQAAIAALTENLQRSELDPFEQAESYREVIQRFGLTQKQLSVMLGMSQSAIGNKLRLLNLAPNIRDKLISAGLSEHHARALLSANEDVREKLLDKTINEGLTAEQLEKIISDNAKEEKKRRSYHRRAGALGDMRLFFNTVERAVEIIRLSGVDAQTERKKTDGYIEYVIRIPDKRTSDKKNVSRGTI